METIDLNALGVERTVYSLIYPETREVQKEFWANAQTDLADLYERPWLKTQNALHHRLFEEWREWSSPVLSLDMNHFPHRYPTNGSSEAIRDAITHLPRGCRIHVFAGEYEGYEAIAKGCGITVIKHDRYDWEWKDHPLGVDAFNEGDVFILSQPSSIDGNLWPQFRNFLALADRLGLNVWVDLCYVGTIPFKYHVDLVGFLCVSKVFWSLSKVFGVYYHRIGGVLSRDEMPGLYGNMWFKNIASIELGRKLMKTYSVYYLPAKYNVIQRLVIGDINRKLLQVYSPDPVLVQPSDVVILGHQKTGDNLVHLEINQQLHRANNINRYCLTPAMNRILTNDPR